MQCEDVRVCTPEDNEEDEDTLPRLTSVATRAQAADVAKIDVYKNDNNTNNTHNTSNNDEDVAIAAEALLRDNRRWGRIAYVALYASFAGTSPFYSVLLAECGLDTIEVGYVAALMPLSTLLVLPPISYITDRYHCASLLLVIALVMSSATLMIVTVATSALPKLLVALVMFVHFVSRCPLTPFYDQRTRALLPPTRKEEWGGIRCFGSYSWGVFAPLLSQLIAMYGWWVAGVSYVVGMTSALFAYTRIHLASPAHATTATSSSPLSPSQQPQPQPRFRDVFSYIHAHPRIAVFLAAECFMGFGYSVIGTYLFLFLTSLGAPTVLLGLSVTMTVVLETPLFQFSRYLHAMFSDRQLLVTSMLSWSFRVTCYSLLQRPWMVLLLEPLHGMTFGLMWISGVHFVNAAFPATLSHTANGLLSSAAFGVGPIVGNLVGGLLYRDLGARVMFRALAVCMALLGGLYTVIDMRLEARGERIDAEPTRPAHEQHG